MGNLCGSKTTGGGGITDGIGDKIKNMAFTVIAK